MATVSATRTLRSSLRGHNRGADTVFANYDALQPMSTQATAVNVAEHGVSNTTSSAAAAVRCKSEYTLQQLGGDEHVSYIGGDGECVRRSAAAVSRNDDGGDDDIDGVLEPGEILLPADPDLVQLLLRQPLPLTPTAGGAISADIARRVNQLVREMTAGQCECCGEPLHSAHTKGEFVCAEAACGKRFCLRSSLARHCRMVHGGAVGKRGSSEAVSSCPQCGLRCADRGSLARHMYTHTGLRPHTCQTCGKHFSRKSHLQRHMDCSTTCSGRAPRHQFPCEICGKLFTRSDNLRDHVKLHAGVKRSRKLFNCTYCDTQLASATLLQEHMRSHTNERPYKCSSCDKDFCSRRALTKHCRTHSGQRPFACAVCGRAFAAKETLNRHMKTHTSERPHACALCGKSFVQASQLKTHMFHHTGAGGFQCHLCGKSFNRRVRLRTHVQYVHEGRKAYSCDQCGKQLVRKEDLVRHQLLHSNVKQHGCPICDKSFAIKSALKTHMLTHTKEPPRSCDECGRAFIRQDCLIRHMRKKHRSMLDRILADAERCKLQQQQQQHHSVSVTTSSASAEHLDQAAPSSVADNSAVLAPFARANADNNHEDDYDEPCDHKTSSPTEHATDSSSLSCCAERVSDVPQSSSLMAEFHAASCSSAPPDVGSAAEAVLGGLISLTSSPPPAVSASAAADAVLSCTALEGAVRELLSLLVDEPTLTALCQPSQSVEQLLTCVIERCGHAPPSITRQDYDQLSPADQLRESARCLFTVVIDDSAVKTLLNSHSVDQVIMHVLKLARV